MEPTLEWTQTAREDLLAIIGYIAADNVDAAQRLKDEIESKAGNLPTFPKIYREGRIPHTREMVVQPNYIVIYTENLFSVRILRILHGAQLWPPLKS